MHMWKHMYIIRIIMLIALRAILLTSSSIDEIIIPQSHRPVNSVFDVFFIIVRSVPNIPTKNAKKDTRSTGFP